MFLLSTSTILEHNELKREYYGLNSCQVDEQWFDLSADLLRKALAITPVIPAHPFELPPSGNIVIDFVNELGYPEPVEITSGSDKPRHPVLQMLWGIVTQSNVDHARAVIGLYNDPDLERAKKMIFGSTSRKEKGECDYSDLRSELFKLSLDPSFLPQVGKGKAVVTEEQVAHSLIDLSKKKRTTDQFILVRRDQTSHDSTTGPSSQPEDDTSEKVIHESSSTSDSERTESETETAAPKGDKDQGEVDSSTVTSGVSIPVSDPEKAHEALAGPDPEPMKEDQTGSDTGQLHMSHLLSHHYMVTPPPINTKATTITTSLPEITPFIALQLRLLIRSQVPTAVDKYLGTKLDDALLKVLERHTTDLIEKYSVLPGPESIQNQESEKSPKEIIRIKKEQGEEKQDSTYSIRSTDKVDLEEFDLKSALFKHMNKIKSANRNTANYRLYHALMEALIADEDAMDKEVADKVKDHKRKHDSDDDEDRCRLSDPESEHSEQSSDDTPIQDEGKDSDMEDTDNAHIPKVLTTTWFKPIPESERPDTPEPEWTIPLNDFSRTQR
ncbi:hypothetical protein Tco_1505707 [Tanacetum coccineum]